MAKASQVVLLENEYYLIKAPNGKVLEVKGLPIPRTALRSSCGPMPVIPGSSGSSLMREMGAGASATVSPARSSICPWAAWWKAPGCTSEPAPAG